MGILEHVTVLGDTLRARRVQVARGALAMAVAATVGLTLIAPLAHADGLTDQRDKVKEQIAQTETALNESSSELTAAAVAVDKAQAALEVAQANLAQTQVEQAAAQQLDTEMAAKLKQAKIDLKAAKAAVVKGQKALDAQFQVAGEQARDQYQQKTNLLPIALLMKNSSTSDMETRLQWSTTMFDTTQATIDELKVLQRKLNAEKAKQTKLENQIAADRKIAAENLETKKRLKEQAATQTATVATLVTAKESAEASAQSQVAADKARYADLNRERSAVEKRIAERVAKQRAEAARKAAAEREARIAAKKAEEARQEREASRQAAQDRADKKAAQKANRQWTPPKRDKPKKHKAKKSSKKSSQRAYSAASSGSSAHHGFIYPAQAPITSPYGMRLHPTLGYWKLHDGTDFGASCGAPIHAAYDGTVSERYFNPGYGNRMIIDHGKVDGDYISTAYNHAIRYTASVGQHVSKGEVIGYVGTTGYSTGCHLHLMVYKNGNMINPMSWY